MRSTHVKIALAAVGLTALVVPPAVASAGSDGARHTPSPVLERGADGKVDAFGGAARLDGDQTSTIQNAIKRGRAKNVILIIGDGMGASELTIGRNYLVGAGGYLKGLDALPLTGQMTHYTVDKKTGQADYVGDSAATGTAWATGVKTYDNAVSVDRFEKPYQTILQWAKAQGKATGDVTTSEIQDATPAVLVANVPLRKCYGPEATSKDCAKFALENGGPGSISEQLLNTRPDVSLGGGAKTFAEQAKAGQWKGKTLEEQAKARGFNYVTSRDALAKVTAANQDKPLLGLFSQGNLPVKFAPLVATARGADGAGAKCTDEPTFAAMPTLGAMTRKSIELLSGSRHGSSNGFFLQVESASIDKKDHAADLCGQIGETQQIDEAVQAALAFAKKNGETLVIVTADHAHTSTIVDDPVPGLNAKVTTADGADMIVAYNTSAEAGYQQHTGAQVPVAGYGPGAANIVGLIDQTDLYFVMKRAMSKG